MMKIDTQTSAERSHLAELIEPISVAMLTTVDDTGALQSRPMSPLALDGQGALWFFTDLRSAKADQLRAANVSFADIGSATYVSLAGHGELSTDRAHYVSGHALMFRYAVAMGLACGGLAVLQWFSWRWICSCLLPAR